MVYGQNQFREGEIQNKRKAAELLQQFSGTSRFGKRRRHLQSV